MLKSKLHRLRVTEANLEYRGSITIDEDLMNKADILIYEKVQVVNINNGERFETYAIPGERGSKTICLNGAAARLAQVGDRVIIMSYAQYGDKELSGREPLVLQFDQHNNLLE